LPAIVRARFAIGRGTEDRERVARTIVALKPGFETIEGADDLAIEYGSADLAIAAFGVAAYELAAAGVPALYLSQSDDDVLSASAFENAGMGLSLGIASRASDDLITGTVKQLLSDATRRRDMRAAALMTVDVHGASRIAADLAQLLAARLAPSEQANFA
jgi:spore coat polysaccharide biosynthesis protein SpsF